MQKEILLFFAIIDLGFSYFAFTGAQYFSQLYMLLIFLLPLISAMIFIFTSTDYFGSGKFRNYITVAFTAASILLIYLNAVFDHPAPYVFNTALYVLWLLSVASAISVAGIYLIGRIMKSLEKRPKKFIYAVVILLLVLTASAAYLSQYGFGNTDWNHVDELAYNYYSSYLFLHGLNPYTQSMKPVLDSRSTIPIPFMLNGTYDYTYYYPALSFLAYIPITAIGVTNLLSFIVVLTFLSVVSAFEVYYKSGFNKLVLFPLAAWLGSSFFLSFSTNAYLAVSALLLFAYTYRNKIAVSGILTGLAASATQLAWFALPFFFLLTARKHGTKKMAKQIAFSFAAFIAINGYFIIISPSATLNSFFSLFFTNRLQFAGINIIQFLLAFYPVSYGYSALISAISLMAMMFLFYFYGKSARTLLAVAPAFIFFLSWRNFAVYGLAYIPLLIMILYTSNESEKKEADKLKSKKPAVVVLGLVVLIAITAAVYLHEDYANSDLVRINSMMPIIYVSQSGQYSLGGVLANLTNNGNVSENVSFYLLSRSPDGWTSIAGSTMPPLKPGTTSDYIINYNQPMINNSTHLFLFVSSRDYITNSELNITIRPPSRIT
jgi:uncharacterized membrane protein